MNNIDIQIETICLKKTLEYDCQKSYRFLLQVNIYCYSLPTKKYLQKYNFTNYNVGITKFRHV